MSLLKSGLHPDDRGDESIHTFTYSLLPHDGDFIVEKVVRPAYQLNVAPTYLHADPSFKGIESMVTVGSPNVIIESIKVSEDGDKVTVRLYEAGEMVFNMKINPDVDSAEKTNMPEEIICECDLKDGIIALDLRAFEIQTYLIKIKPNNLIEF